MGVTDTAFILQDKYVKEGHVKLYPVVKVQK